MIQFKVKFTQAPVSGWEAEGIIENTEFAFYAPNLPTCLRAVANKVEDVLRPSFESPYRVIMNDR